MTNTEKLIVENFYKRFEQVKGLSVILKDKYENSKELVDKVQEGAKDNPKKTTKDFIEEIKGYKQNEIESMLLNQQIQSYTTRLLEYYSLITIGGLEIQIDEKDENFLKEVGKSVDLYGVEKGKLVVLDTNFGGTIKERVTNMEKPEQEAILTHMLNVK
jgi:hypothetical protein